MIQMQSALGLVTDLHVLQLHLKPAPFRPAVVHAEKHVRPIVGLGATRARLNRENRVVAKMIIKEL